VRLTLGVKTAPGGDFIPRKNTLLWPVFNKMRLPLRIKFDPRGELYPLWKMLTPSLASWVKILTQ
jgi:hypothetical protein